MMRNCKVSYITNYFKVMKSSRMRQAGHVAPEGKKKCIQIFGEEN
jgi:hypothetical protein